MKLGLRHIPCTTIWSPPLGPCVIMDFLPCSNSHRFSSSSEDHYYERCQLLLVFSITMTSRPWGPNLYRLLIPLPTTIGLVVWGSRVTVTVTVTHNRVKHMAHDDDRPSPLSTAIFIHQNIRIQAPSITFHAARSASRWSAGVSQNEIPSLGFPVPTVY